VDASIESARLVFVELGYSALPVVDARGMPVGVVSTIDLLRVVPEYEFHELDAGGSRQSVLDRFAQPAEENDAELFEAGEGFFVLCIPEQAVGAIMTPVVCTVSEHASLPEAAGLMAAYELSRLPVADSDGRIVGTISSLDIVRHVADGAAFRAPVRGR
jgi:CBS domain-containing protein